MNVLFISNGSRLGKIDSLIENQSYSLRKEGICVDHFLILQSGIKGYLKGIKELRKVLKQKNFDIIHAHYGFCGLVALLSGLSAPLVVSFMGSDLHGSKLVNTRDALEYVLNRIISFIVQGFSRKIIVKSKGLLSYVYFKNKASIIPNGVNVDFFAPVSKETACNNLKIELSQESILFLGDKDDSNKNFSLLKSAYTKNCIHDEVILLAPYPVNPDDVLWYLNACRLLVFCSFKEGSPNVIKEAMACNCPIVSTDVGDIKEVIGNTDGCYIASYDPIDVAQKIKLAMEFSRTMGRTNGRQRIMDLGLDAATVAKKILSVYDNAVHS